MRKLARLLAAAGAVALVLAGCSRPAARLSGGVGTAPAGAVASGEPVATAAGLEILRDGGNAVDAIVATALALAVVHPQAGNLGGGGFAVIKSGAAIAALDFRETAPAAATERMYLDATGGTKGDLSVVGPLAAGVPGSPAGLYELHRRYGRRPWGSVVAPAIRLARDGFKVTPRLTEAIGWYQETLAKFPETAGVWLPGGKPPSPGTVLKLPELAATLQAYARDGPAAIVEGPVAAAVESAAGSRGGVLTAADLSAYRPVWREPLRFHAYGWEMAGMPLPSSGGLILAQSLAILERLKWESGARFGADRYHLLAETWRRAFADRFLLGDPAHTLVDAGQILSPDWIASRAAGIDPLKATPSPVVHPWPGEGTPESLPMKPAATTHLSAADGSGMVVSLTTTLNEWFGCGLYVPAAGFFLNDEMDDFVTAPGRPNLYGLIQGEANAVRPGARMLSSMCPLVAWRAGESIALGSRGGSRIPNVTLQVLLNLIVDHDDLRQAVDRPRLHHQWWPDEIVAENDALDAAVKSELERRGHKVRTTDGLGEVAAVRVLEGGRLEAAADDRRDPGGAGVLTP